MSEVLKFYLEWLSVKKRDWTRELPASIGLGTWPSAEPVSCLSYFLDAQDSMIWVAHASEAIPRPALKVSNHVALCFLMGSQLSFKVTKVQLVHIKLNSIGLTKVRNNIMWLRGWWGQSIGNCLRGGCCQKPQWVVGIDGGAIEDADCRTFLAQTIPNHARTMLKPSRRGSNHPAVAPLPWSPDIHTLLPASLQNPPDLRHLHKAPQAAPSHTREKEPELRMFWATHKNWDMAQKWCKDMRKSIQKHSCAVFSHQSASESKWWQDKHILGVAWA